MPIPFVLAAHSIGLLNDQIPAVKCALKAWTLQNIITHADIQGESKSNPLKTFAARGRLCRQNLPNCLPFKLTYVQILVHLFARTATLLATLSSNFNSLFQFTAIFANFF